MALVDNLVSYYNFEGNSNDSKGTNDGTAFVVSWVRSLNNLAARFDGNVSSISVPNDASLQITGDLSIAFQIIPNSLALDQDIIAKSNNGEYYISLLETGDIVFTHGDGGAGLESFNLLDAGSFLTVGEKAHILITRDSSANTIVAYKNGQQITSTSYTTTPLATTTDLTIGEDLDNNELDADLDELAIWDRALDSAEASDLYNNGKLQVYDSESDSFVATTGYKRYSLLSEDGDAGDFWTQLIDKDRYLESEDVVLTQGGLLAQYYDGQDFDTLDTTRIDSTVDFDFGSSEPAGTNVGATDYSIRWTGYLLPEFSETYTLYIGSDDGTRLYIDGDLLIDNWADQGYNQESETIALEAGKYYHVEIEFYQGGGGAEVDFYWESASQAYEVVPSTNLYYTVESQSYNVYSTIADWQLDRNRNLAALAEKEILDIRGQWSSSTPEINLIGWTTDIDEDYFVVIQTIELSKPGIVYSQPTLPSHFRIESTQASSPAITISGFSIELKNIQAESEDDVISIDTNAGDIVRILFSHLRNTNQSSAGININNSAGRVDVAGTVIENASDGILATANNTGIVYIVESTITECVNGITTNDTEVRPTSCAIFNNTDDFNGAFPENWPRYCASDDDDVGVQGVDISPGATESDDWDDAFVDYVNGDFRIASDTSVLYESAEPDLGFTYYASRSIPYLDAGNAPRPQNDIGAFSFTNWWDYRYTERFQITVPSAEVPTDLTDFTLYIDLSKINSYSGLWRRADSNGLDLRVTNSERERVPQELVFIDTDLKDGEIWAKVDLSSTDDATFYVYYNYTPFSEEPVEPDYPPATNVHGQYEVWSDYVAVWHLQDLSIADATSNGYNGTVRGTPSVVTDGRFGYSIEWNETGSGNEESADVGNIQTDSTWTAITIESWFRKDTTGDERMICKSEGGVNVADHIFALHSQDRGNFISTRIGTDTTDAVTFDGDLTFTTGTWQFATAIWDSADETARLFVNGQPDNTYTHTGNHIATSSQQVEIANVDNSTTDRFWEGGLDEIRVAKVRFPNYQERLEAQYNNQTSEAFGDAAPQPDTNPVLPPIEEVAPAGTWTDSAGSSATLDIDIDIPELTGKLALLIGVTNENGGVSQVDSITLDGVNATKAGQNTQGTGFSNTSEIWYYLNDDLPTTPGTYTVSITMTAAANGIGATIALYDIILQEAPVYSGDNLANDDVISIDATIDTSISESNLVFEVSSAGASNTSTISDGQTQIADIEVGTSGARHAASFGVYYDAGTETITRTYSGSTNRLAQSILVLKSGEEKNYTYTGIGTVSTAGSAADSLVIEIIFEGIDGAAIAGIADIDFEVIYSPAGEMILSGDVAATLHFVYEAIPAAIAIAGESDYFPVFYWAGVDGITLTGEPEYYPVFYYTMAGDALHLGGSDYYIVFARTGSGGAVFSGESNYYPVFYRAGTGGATFAGEPEYYPVFYWTATGTMQLLGETVGIVTVLIFVAPDGSIYLLSVGDINPSSIEISFKDQPTGSIFMDQPNVVVSAEYEPHYVYEPKLPLSPNLQFKGGAAWQIEESEFYYQASGKALFRGKAAYTFFANEVYVASGGARFRPIHNLVDYYLDTANYIYTNVSGGAIFTPISLSRVLTLYAIDPSGKIEFVAPGNINADQVFWRREYVASGALKTKITSAPVEYSVNLHYDVKSKPIVFSGAAGIILKSSLYYYTASGGIEILTSRFYSWTSTGKLLFSGTIGTVDAGVILVKSYVYVASGKITMDPPGAAAKAEYEPVYAYAPEGDIEITGSAQLESITSYEASGTLTVGGASEHTIAFIREADSSDVSLNLTPSSVREAEYIHGPSIGGAELAGSFEKRLVFIHDNPAGGILVAGQSNIVYQEYTASGGIVLSYAPGITGTITINYVYRASGKFRFIRKLFVPRALTYIYSVKVKKLRLNGLATTRLANISYPDYTASGMLSAAGVSSYLYTNLYSSVAAGALVFAGAATTNSLALYSYEAAGTLNFAGAATYATDALSYLYAAAGNILLDGNAGASGQDFYEYEATGSLNSFGLTQVNYRFVIQRLTNTTEAPRTLREPMAQKVFTFYTNE